MGNRIKILVVEDEMIIAAKISLFLTDLGYNVVAILPSGEEALQHILTEEVDLILLDIHLKGKIDGIETAVQLQKISKALVIYLTANSEDATFNRAKTTRPAGFISKPFKRMDLQRSIELAMCRMTDDDTASLLSLHNKDVQQFILEDRIFVKGKDRMIKIMLTDVLYIEADRNYSRIFTSFKEFLLSVTLKSIEEKLPKHTFIRIHRSYIVNMTQIEEVDDSSVMIAGKPVPMSAGLKDNLLQRLKTF